MYHVGLALEPDQIKQLRQLALDRDKTVREFVTDLVLAAIAEKAKKEKKEKQQ